MNGDLLTEVGIALETTGVVSGALPTVMMRARTGEH